MEILKYKSFEGSAELDMQKKFCWGKILYIDDVVTYQSESIANLQKQFEEAVDDYIETCKLVGKEPQKPCRGLFNVRVSPELHKAALRRAITDETSLNDVVCRALESYLSPKSDLATLAGVKRASPAGTWHVYELKPPSDLLQSRRFDAFVNSETVVQDLTDLVSSNYWLHAGKAGDSGDLVPKIYETSHAH